MENTSADILQAVILTKNEEPNLKRVLDKLTWIGKIIIVDSFSTDETVNIANSYPNVTLVQRQFDTHATQWNYGLSLANAKWMLSLDADYVLTTAFCEEILTFIKQDNRSAYLSNFTFLVFGKPLRKDNTTPRPVLFKKADCIYYDDGHTQRLRINGETGEFANPILHDDRKSLSRWLSNQDSYSIKECNKLLNTANDKVSFSSKIRKNKILAPFIVFFYSLFVKGLILDGWAGWHYTLQRTMVEMLLALRLIEEEKLKDKKL
ncbi:MULTISPECIES: glycosyltransferase family 2 protein [unclassified Mucilaginibacter]|uniref:glycosyltransferase family 2 protein n=1 Tax=unclassified Mucilaginibacter TaxID=2617802 RepID=UPI0031F70387